MRQDAEAPVPGLRASALHLLSRRSFLRAGAATAATLTPLSSYAKSLGPQREWIRYGPDPLEGAIKAARWIRTAEMDTAEGRYWVSEPDHPGKETSPCQQNGIRGGGAGIVLFLLQMAQATGDTRYLESARRGADYLTSAWPELLRHQANSPGEDLSFDNGVAGIAFALAETWKAVPDPRYQQAARVATDAITQRMAWPEPTSIAQENKLVLYLLYAAKTFNVERYRSLATRTGLHLIELGTPQCSGGMSWQDIDPALVTLPPKTCIADIEHRTAEVALALARLYEETHQSAFLDAAQQGSVYLQNMANPSESEIVSPHPGVHAVTANKARLFYQMYKVTGTEAHLAWLEEIALDAIQREESVHHRSGSWETVCQANGTAGLMDLLLDLSRVTGRTLYADIVNAWATRLVRQNTDFDGSSYRWEQRFPWILPSAISAQTGYLHGAAGIGAALLHASCARRGKDQTIVFPDNPFTNPGMTA